MHPGPTPDRDGLDPAPRGSDLGGTDGLGHLGAGPVSTCAGDLARAIAFVVETPRGGYVTSIELQPEAPLSSAPRERQQLKYPEESQTGHAVKEARRCPGGEGEHGHLEEFRTDPIALMQRVRDECGDV